MSRTRAFYLVLLVSDWTDSGYLDQVPSRLIQDCNNRWKRIQLLPWYTLFLTCRVETCHVQGRQTRPSLRLANKTRLYVLRAIWTCKYKVSVQFVHVWQTVISKLFDTLQQRRRGLGSEPGIFLCGVCIFHLGLGGFFQVLLSRGHPGAGIENGWIDESKLFLVLKLFKIANKATKKCLPKWLKDAFL